MPISLILTPFDHFQIRPTFAVTPNLILESCRIQLFLLNIFQVQKKTHYIKIWMGWSAKSCRVWRIFKNFEYILFKYFPIQIFVCIIFVSFFCTNIFGYLFVLFFYSYYCIVAKSCQKSPKVDKRYKKLPKCAKSCNNLPKFAKSCNNLPKFAKSCQKLQKVVKSCQKVPKVAKSCKKL